MTAVAAAAQRHVPPISRGTLGLLLVGLIAVLYVVFAGQWTLPHDDDAVRFHQINGIREWIDENRNTNVVLVVLVTGIRVVITALVDAFMLVLHGVGWLGLTAIGGALGFAIAGWRLGLLAVASFLAFGILGLFERSVDTLALTLASVVLSLAIGIPLGIVAGRRPRFLAAIQPVLDVMQILPTFAYLPLITLFFLIGPASAAIATMIYAIPPAIRITALGIREVSPATVEAATSLGSTPRQVLTKVQLPMARRAIILGINQTIMMALSMVVITSLIDAPGLGKNILHALQQNNVGLAFDAGIAIVIMAIMLDRLTSAASERMDPAKATVNAAFGATLARRPIRLLLVGVPAAAVAASIWLVGGGFPDGLRFSFQAPINAAVKWVSFNLYGLTEGTKNVITSVLINPIQTFLTESPWWLIVLLVLAIAALVGGRRAAIIAAACFLGLIAMEMWEHSMATLAQVLVATVLTLAVGLAFGIAAARSNRFSRFLRPVLDAAQTMPAFVYLLPAVALFAPTRFTAIVAAVIYAVPAVIRLVEIGIRTVPITVREAATAAGATDRQLLWKVELPMARQALLVAANQGIILVLAMVVVGGLVGGGGLGYDVVAGFARRDFFGEGVAAGIACVLLGIALDRITQGAGRDRRRKLASVLAVGPTRT
ncbi:MAG: ABC transporter permease subunit [Candidatus Limnocylindrales bacterium]